MIFTLALISLTSCGQNQDAAIKTIEDFIQAQAVDKSKENWKKQLTIPPQAKFSAEKKYFWKLETTEGLIEIEFLANDAPMHVSSTVYLTLLGFYDDLTIHRVIPGFVAQGGDPNGNGTGGPGYKYAGEYDGPAQHDRAGVLSMANAGQGTDGSQFFITFNHIPHLNGKHTVFGYVTSGMDVLKQIEQLGSRSGKTRHEIKIIKASISVI